MNWLFYSSIALCLSYVKKIEPGVVMSMYEHVTLDHQHIDFAISPIAQNDNFFYRIVKPYSKKNETDKEYGYSSSGEEEDNVEEMPLVRKISERFEKPGIYLIQIYNKGSEAVDYTIYTNQVKKIPKSNESVVELRNLIDSIHSAVKDLDNDNLFARKTNDTNMREANTFKRNLRILVIVPILTAVIAYVKYVFARNLVRPKGKRFKGLF